jgi:hypothetical protein
MIAVPGASDKAQAIAPKPPSKAVAAVVVVAKPVVAQAGTKQAATRQAQQAREAQQIADTEAAKLKEKKKENEKVAKLIVKFTETTRQAELSAKTANAQQKSRADKNYKAEKDRLQSYLDYEPITKINVSKQAQKAAEAAEFAEAMAKSAL